MEWLTIVLAIVALLAAGFGIAGCVLPGLPGPILTYASLIIFHFADQPFVFKWWWLVIWAVVAILLTILDYVAPIYTTRKFGGTKGAVWGCTIGLVVGMLAFPPWGIIFGPLVGAIVGDLIAGQKIMAAVKAGTGSFIGFLLITAIKLFFAILMTVHLCIKVIAVAGGQFWNWVTNV